MSWTPYRGVATLVGLMLLPWGAAAAEGEGPSERVPVGSFVDEAGAVRQPSAVYLRHLDDAEPGHLLTIGEELLFLGAGTTWYWIDRERNLADWDYPSWEQRLNLEAWRYDNNSFPINYLAHALNGAAFYAIPRANGHGVWASAGYALATSFAWEFLIEFREKVSINDVLVTQGSGMVIGEFAAKLWHYVNGLPAGASGAKRTLGAVGGFPVWAKRKLYGEPEYVAGPYDRHGFASSIGAELGAGFESRFHAWTSESATRGESEGSVSTHGVWLGGRLSTIPGEGRPGHFDYFFHQADVAWLSLFGGFGAGAEELDLFGDLHLLGLYTQALDARGSGPQATFALNTAYRYRFRDFPGYNDRLGILHLPGPGLDMSYRLGGAELGLYWRLNADHAGIHAASYGDWRDATRVAGDRPKTILRKHGYYYGWGVSSRMGAGLLAEPVSLRVSATLGAYDSHEGLDRAQEELSKDPDSDDRFLEVDASLGLTVPGTPLHLGVGWAGNRRDSSMEGFTTQRTLQTWSARVGAVL